MNYYTYIILENFEVFASININHDTFIKWNYFLEQAKTIVKEPLYQKLKVKLKNIHFA